MDADYVYLAGKKILGMFSKAKKRKVINFCHLAINSAMGETKYHLNLNTKSTHSKEKTFLQHHLHDIPPRSFCPWLSMIYNTDFLTNH